MEDKKLQSLINEYMPKRYYGHEARRYAKVIAKLYAESVVNNNAILPHVSNRFSPKQMAEWFHNNYEEIAKAEGWQTQDKCKVEFKDLPESNRITMIKVCERWLNGC